MDTIEIRGQGDQTTIAVQTALNNTLFAKRTLAHDAMGVKFMQWLREIPDVVRTKLLAGIYIEYALAAHINTKNEEDALAELNVRQDDVVDVVVGAVNATAKRDSEHGPSSYVTVDEICAYLHAKHFDLPPSAVRIALKTFEYEGRYTDAGDGVFVL